MGQHDVGNVQGGTNQISDFLLKKELENALARNGYRPADVDHTPTQVLFFAWGMHNKIESLDDASNYKNLLSRAKTIGGQKFADEYEQALKQNDMKHFSARDDITGTLVHAVQNDCYYLIVAAFDVEALKHNTKKVLWTTHISTISQGAFFEAKLPGIIDNAASFCGREMPPKVVRQPASRHAEVTLNEVTVAK
jgi:hypothetical protein